jgi:DNA invertase Pin-like site-specific DNA recombinase
MSGAIGDRTKIQAEHLSRTAFIYVRQSSPRQVRENLESQRRQYGFADHAAELGWSRESIVIVDEDQGRSGAVAQSRPGFARVVAAVARREAGIVMSLEISRLSRNDADWHQLVYLCRWTDTLIADEHGVYDPASSADRMVLGVRGQVSELERDNSVHRMVEARWSKARRGEAFTLPPAGYELDDAGQLVLSPDEAVVNAIRQVFTKLDELGGARQVFLWWRAEGLPFPVRRIAHRTHPVDWAPVSYRIVLHVLHHPIFAGAFVFGRSRTVRELDAKTQRVVVRRGGVRNQPRDWPVLIKEHHSAYITWEKFLSNQERIRANNIMGTRSDESHRGAPREGKALLQGLARCGHCGRRMHVGYGGMKASRTLQYRCARHCLLVAGAAAPTECQIVGGKRIEAEVVKALLTVCEQAGVEASSLAGVALREELEATQRSWRLQLEKAEYEAQRAERQFMAVEPENRTVARELERRWNERLAHVEHLRSQAAVSSAGRAPLTEEEVARALQLGTSLEAVWDAPTTTMRDRKQLLRALVEEVQLRSEEKQYLVCIVWKGGATTQREVPRLNYGQQVATSADVVEEVRELAVELDDAQIARVLHRQGRRSGLGVAFTKAAVAALRHRNEIPVCPKKRVQDPREGPFTADEAARELGVSMSTVHTWLRDGVLAGKQLAPKAPWRIVLTQEVRLRLAGGSAPAGWVGIEQAAVRLGISRGMVAYLVKHGKLKGVRTKVGKRECWRIDLSSADCARQTDLIDRIGNPKSKES